MLVGLREEPSGPANAVAANPQRVGSILTGLHREVSPDGSLNVPPQLRLRPLVRFQCFYSIPTRIDAACRNGYTQGSFWVHQPLRSSINVQCSFFYQGCNLLRPRNIARFAGARDFDLVTISSCGVPQFKVGLMVRSLTAAGLGFVSYFCAPAGGLGFVSYLASAQLATIRRATCHPTHFRSDRGDGRDAPHRCNGKYWRNTPPEWS